MKKASRYFKPLARAGYFSRGVIYLIIGFFAALAALGGGENKDTKGALQEVLSQTLGTFLIALMIAGLIGYVIWRLVQSIFDTDDHGWSIKGIGVRIGLLASAFTYTTLAIYAASRIGWVWAGSSDSGSGSAASFIAGFIGSRGVAWTLAAVFFVVGLAHYWKAVRLKFADHFDADDRRMRFIIPVSVIGLIARGTVFEIIAFLLVFRGATVESGSGAPDIKDAMEFIQGLPFGSALLGAMAAGIMLFAVYSFCEAVWRRINVRDGEVPV